MHASCATTQPKGQGGAGGAARLSGSGIPLPTPSSKDTVATDSRWFSSGTYRTSEIISRLKTVLALGFKRPVLLILLAVGIFNIRFVGAGTKI